MEASTAPAPSEYSLSIPLGMNATIYIVFDPETATARATLEDDYYGEQIPDWGLLATVADAVLQTWFLVTHSAQEAGAKVRRYVLGRGWTARSWREEFLGRMDQRMFYLNTEADARAAAHA